MWAISAGLACLSKAIVSIPTVPLTSTRPGDCGLDHTAGQTSSAPLVSLCAALIAHHIILSQASRGVRDIANMPASLVDLNDDVLLTLVSFLDSHSARQLSQTARAVHVMAKHRALESVTLTSFEKTTKFCEYMLKDMPHRLPALRELRLHTPLSDPLLYATFRYIRSGAGVANTARIRREARLLAAMLANTQDLRVLVMYSMEYWIAHSSKLRKVLASLQHLEEVTLENAGPMTGEFINTMLAKPRRLAFLNEKWVPYEVQYTLSLSPRLCLPSVEYLVAYDPIHQSREIRAFARSFPNVRRLDILRMPIFSPEDVTVKVDWPSLERVRGGVFSFDWKNLNGVHMLQLINRLSTTIINAHPTTLRLSLESVGPVACVSAIPAIRNVQPVALIIHMDVTAEGQLWESIVETSARLRYLAVLLDDARLPNDVLQWWVSMHSTALMTATLLICCTFASFPSAVA